MKTPKQQVLERYPSAICVSGCGSWFVFLDDDKNVTLGEGRSASSAWYNAAYRIEVAKDEQTMNPDIMSTKLEMPDNLPLLPPVPEGYDRWEYRGRGASGLERYAYFCCEVGHLDWRVQVKTDLPSNGVPSYHYIEAVKDEPQKPTTISEPDMVNSPPHYQGDGIECIDAIRAALTPEEFRGYVKGNALKYIWREKHKGGDQDLEKAAWYLNRINQEKP